MKKLLFFLFVLGIPSISFAQKDEQAVAAAVERFRVALLNDNEAELNKLTSAKLSYGHSSDLMEDKAAFTKAIMSGEANFTKVEITGQSISFSGDVAIVRHKLFGETHNKGKEPGPIKLGVLMIWQKEKSNWVLLARQAFRLP